MGTPTMAELIEQRGAIDKAIAEQELAPLKAALDMLTNAAAGEFVVGLSSLRDSLAAGSQGHEQVGNLLKVFSAVATILTSEVARAGAMIAPPSPITPAV